MTKWKMGFQLDFSYKMILFVTNNYCSTSVVFINWISTLRWFNGECSQRPTVCGDRFLVSDLLHVDLPQHKLTKLHFLTEGQHIWLLLCFGSRITAIHHRKQSCDSLVKSQRKVGCEPFGTFCWREGASTSLSLISAQYAASFLFKIKYNCGWCVVVFFFFLTLLANGCSLGNNGLINKVFWPHLFAWYWSRLCCNLLQNILHSTTDGHYV